MSAQFKTVGILAKTNHPDIVKILASLLHILQQLNVSVVIADNSAKCIKDNSIKVFPLNQLGEHCDLMISVGGDGTFLTAAHASAKQQTPLVGINLGRVGFLVDVLPTEMHTQLKEILTGSYTEESRHLLAIKIIRDQQIIHQEKALNEVVIHRWVTASMIEITTHINGQFLNSQRSDGLIIATPTGSTAYALSAGGPILHPSLNALVLVPLNPHTLSNRPIVIDDNAEIEISFAQTRQMNALITCDHLEIPSVLISDKVLISKDPTPIRILHPKAHDFFYTLRKKLNWSGGNASKYP